MMKSTRRWTSLGRRTMRIWILAVSVLTSRGEDDPRIHILATKPLVEIYGGVTTALAYDEMVLSVKPALIAYEAVSIEGFTFSFRHEKLTGEEKHITQAMLNYSYILPTYADIHVGFSLRDVAHFGFYGNDGYRVGFSTNFSRKLVFAVDREFSVNRPGGTLLSSATFRLGRLMASDFNARFAYSETSSGSFKGSGSSIRILGRRSLSDRWSLQGGLGWIRSRIRSNSGRTESDLFGTLNLVGEL